MIFFLLELSIISKFSTITLLHFHKKINKINNKKERKEPWNCLLMPISLFQSGRHFCSVFPQMCQLELRGVALKSSADTEDFSNQGAWKSCLWVEVLVSVLLAYGLNCVRLGPSYLF